jgi:polysaccharide biosynthesis transport protein
VVGLLIGLGAAFLIDHLDDKIRSEEDLELATGRPVLSVVPVDPPPDNLPIALSEPTHDAVEAYRGCEPTCSSSGSTGPFESSSSPVRSPARARRRPRRTSPSCSPRPVTESHWSTATCAAAVARGVRHSADPGFTDLLLGMDAKDVVHHVDVDAGNQLSVYASGTVPSNPSEMLSGRRVSQAPHGDGGALRLRHRRLGADPAGVRLGRARRIGRRCARRRPRRPGHPGQRLETLERLDRVAAPVLGMVLNQASKVSKEYYAYGGYTARQAPTLPTGGRSARADVVTSDA